MATPMTYARPYAQAAFEYAQRHHTVAGWSKALSALTNLVKKPVIQQLLSQPAITPAQLTTVFADLLGQQATPAISNFIQLLASYQKLSLLPLIAQVFDEAKQGAQNSTVATLVSTHAVEAGAHKKMVEQLTQRFGRKIDVQQLLDASLLGGAKVMVGDQVMDGSLQQQLKALAIELKQG